MEQSNKRYFNTFFYEDPYVETLNSNETLVFLTLMLNPHTNMSGIYEISIRKLSSYTKLDEDIIKSSLLKLQNDRKILFSDNWLALKNFFKNNKLNPTMIYKSFNLMQAAPSDKVIFILADKDGNPEPWVKEYVIGIEKGINQVKASKYRALVNKSKIAGLPVPDAPSIINFTYETLQKELLCIDNGMIDPIEGGMVGGMVGGTVQGYHGPNKNLNKNINLEYKDKDKDRSVYDGVEDNNSKFESFSPASPSPSEFHPKNLSEMITDSIAHWNTKDNLPDCPYTVLNLSDIAAVKEKFDALGVDKINKAIDYLSTYFDKIEAKYRPKAFHTFVIRSVDNWLEAVKPWERFDSESGEIQTEFAKVRF